MNSRLKRVTHAFVEFMPPDLKSGVVYISVEYKTMAHLCCCGCGNKVITPLSPTGWQLAFDGKTITIWPSIGSWNLECQSHYWIKKNDVHWAAQWPQWMINAGFDRDKRIKQEYFGEFDDQEATATGSGEGLRQQAASVADEKRRNDAAARDEGITGNSPKRKGKR